MSDNINKNDFGLIALLIILSLTTGIISGALIGHATASAYYSQKTLNAIKELQNEG